MQTMDYNPYESRWAPACLELLRVCFPEQKIDERSFHWKYTHPFFSGKIQGFLAIDKGHIRSLVFFAPFWIRRGEERYRFWNCIVMATHPDYRRQGHVSKLVQLFQQSGDDAGFFGFSNTAGKKIDQHSKKSGYPIIGAFQTAIIPVLPSAKTTPWTREIALPELFQKQSERLQIKKTDAFLRWRYGDRPGREYLFLRRKDGLLAIIHEGKWCLHLLDLIGAPEDPALMQALVKELRNYAWQRKKLCLNITVLRNHFWETSLPKPHIWKSVDTWLGLRSHTEQNLFSNKEDWQLMGGDIL